MERLDGNAIGGVLAEIFGVDVTTASRVCLGCGSQGVVAEAHVYVRAPGIVMRCPDCESVLLRIVRSPTRTWLDLSGLRALELRH